MLLKAGTVLIKHFEKPWSTKYLLYKLYLKISACEVHTIFALDTNLLVTVGKL